MNGTVDKVLDERKGRTGRRRRTLSLVLSFLIHAALIVGFLLAPALEARLRPPPEFTRVRIVPLKALGVPEPRPKLEPAKPVRKVESAPSPKKEAAKETPPRLASPKPAEERPAPAPPAPPLQRRGSPDGSSLGTTPFGATAGLDDPNFRYDYYIEQMLAIIGNNWVRPSVGAVQMTVHFRIARDGSLSEVEVVARSGSFSFDLAGERAVRLSSPLPPLPSSYRHPSLGVNLIIR